MGRRTFCQVVVHAVFGTKRRQPWLTGDVEQQMYRHFNRTAHEVGCKVLVGDGTADHVHLLLSMPPSLSVSEVVGKIKGTSSRWASSTHPQLEEFSWQEGFGAFSVSTSQMDKVARSIRNQKQHHLHESYLQELIGLLEAHDIEYDPRLFD